jgi:hypothetical protein
MNEAEITKRVTESFPDVELAEAQGVTFFFLGHERKFPFATLVTRDNDYDRFSNLDRPGVFRLNVGVSKQTFQDLFGSDGADAAGTYDFTALDKLMPHPVYGKMYWVSVLNPSPATFEQIQPLLAEAYDIFAKKRAKEASDQA